MGTGTNTINNRTLERDGFCLIQRAFDRAQIECLKKVVDDVFHGDEQGVRARSSRGHVYAARNLIRSAPEVQQFWQVDRILLFVRDVLGPAFGLVRVLFFDKPPDRTWALGYHKDLSIAVQDNSLPSAHFSRPTLKAGVPHVIASDEILRQMVTLRVHLDEVTSENGALRVIPESHHSTACVGVGTDHATSICAAAGDVLAMRPLLTHGSGASSVGTRLHRRIVHLEFAGQRALPDGYEWHDFVVPSFGEE